MQDFDREEGRRLARAHGAVDAFRFGDGPALNAELLGLVLAGRKTGTCFPHADVERGEEWLPKAGDRSLSLDWEGRPVLVIETVSVELTRFDEVGEDFALSEGENDSLAGWRADHEAYFRRLGVFAPDMLLVCERFRVVEVIGKV